jgi:hypothetical protein
MSTTAVKGKQHLDPSIGKMQKLQILLFRNALALEEMNAGKSLGTMFVPSHELELVKVASMHVQHKRSRAHHSELPFRVQMEVD